VSKPMKWAVEAFIAAVGEHPETVEAPDYWTDEALAIQRAAEPLLAVVRDCFDTDGECMLCRGNPHLPSCPVPAALKAMEEA